MSTPLRKIENDLRFITQVGSSTYGGYTEEPYVNKKILEMDRNLGAIYPVTERADINLTDRDVENINHTVSRTPFETLTDKETKLLFNEISRIKTDIQDNDYSKNIFDRINSLVNSSIEDMPGHTPINPSSLHNFINFTVNYPGLFHPLISINPSRYIHARWDIDKAHRLVLEFLPNKEILFYISYKSAVRPYKTRRYASKLLPTELIGDLAKLGLLNLYTEQ